MTRVFIKWLLENEIIIAVMIAIIGWLITHILSIRAQNKNFKNNIINESRLQISKDLKNYKLWLAELYSYLGNLKMRVEIEREVDSILTKLIFEQKQMNEAIEMVENKNNEWIFSLEEYEILYPQLTELRYNLISRDRVVSNITNQLRRAITDKDKESTKDMIVKINNSCKDFIMDQMCLIEDLQKHMQNLCLSEITKNTIPEREVEGNKYPKVVIRRNGTLEIENDNIKEQEIILAEIIEEQEEA